MARRTDYSSEEIEAISIARSLTEAQEAMALINPSRSSKAVELKYYDIRRQKKAVEQKFGDESSITTVRTGDTIIKIVQGQVNIDLDKKQITWD